MKSATSRFPIPHVLSRTLTAAAFVISFCLPISARQPAPDNVEAQRGAMRKLSFLTGHWSGPVTILRSPRQALHLTQTEDVEYKLNGLVLLIEGRSTGADGRVLFSALATIAYDDTSHTYRFRAYNDGHYLDTELSVLPNGFSWGFTAGPAHIVNTMNLTPQGKWDEVSEVSVGGNPPHPGVDMVLQHLP